MNLPYITRTADIGYGVVFDLACSVDCAEGRCVRIVEAVSPSDIEDTVIATCTGCGRVLIEDGVLVVQ